MLQLRQFNLKLALMGARTLGKDPKFYKFIRSLEAYEKSVPDESKLLLSTDSKFWEVLSRGR